MRVQIFKSVDIDAEVSVSVEDITAALVDALEEAKTKEKSRHVVNLFINSVWQCLSAMTDEMIDRMKPEHRKLVAESLTEQAGRFRESSDCTFEDCTFEDCTTGVIESPN